MKANYQKKLEQKIKKLMKRKSNGDNLSPVKEKGGDKYV